MKENTKKVLFVATVDSHIELFHLPYLEMFKKRGYEVHVATNTDKPIKFCDKKIKIPIERNPFRLKNLKAIKELKKVINEEKYDIIHCHTPMGGVVARLAAKKARKNGTRVIYTAHGFHFYTGAPLRFWTMFYPVEKYLAKHTDTLITINTEDFERAKRKFGKRCKDIQYVPGVGVDEKKFSKKLSAAEKSELRKSLGLKDDDFVMICVGRLDTNKNQGFLIDTTRELLKEDKKYHLLLVGPDENSGYFQEQAEDIKDHIHFLGKRSDIVELLNISDVALSASKREGLPVNLIEAAIAGAPIVATGCRGNRDVTKNTTNDDAKFIEMIKNSANPASQKSDVKTEEFTIENVSQEMQSIYFKQPRNMAFIYDVRMKYNRGKYYTDTNLDRSILNKYLRYFDSITFVSRKEPISDNELHRYSIASGENIDFVPVKNLSSAESRKIVKKAVAEHDFVITRLPSILGLYACRACNKSKTPYLVEFVGNPFPTLWYYGKLKYRLVSPIISALNRHYIKKAENVIYVTKEYLQKSYPNYHRNIGVSDVNIILCNKDILEKRINRTYDNTLKIGAVGSLNVRYKGHLCAIKTAGELKRAGVDFEMHFLGQCSEENRKKWIKIAKKHDVDDRIFFDGTLPSGEPVMRWLDSLDFFIMPSIAEGLPRTMLEAMSRGLVCFGSRVGGIPELLDEKYLFEKGDHKGFANAIIHCVKNRDEIVRQNKRNYQKASEYTPEALDGIKNAFMCDILNIDRNRK